MGFLLEQARKRRLVRLMDDHLVAHGDPKKVDVKLRREMGNILRPQQARGSDDGFVRFAEQMGDHKAARRMRIENSVVQFLQRERKGADA